MPFGLRNIRAWRIWTLALTVLSSVQGDESPKEWGQAGSARVQGRKWKAGLMWEGGFDPSSKGWAGFK